MSEVPVTQILSFAFESEPVGGLKDNGEWAKILDLAERGPGAQRIYWGRSHEHPKHAQLHIGEWLKLLLRMGQSQRFFRAVSYSC